MLQVHPVQLRDVAQRRAELRVVRRHAAPHARVRTDAPPISGAIWTRAFFFFVMRAITRGHFYKCKRETPRRYRRYVPPPSVRGRRTAFASAAHFASSVSRTLGSGAAPFLREGGPRRVVEGERHLRSDAAG